MPLFQHRRACSAVLADQAADDLSATLAKVGITENVFRTQLFDEPGPSPKDKIR